MTRRADVRVIEHRVAKAAHAGIRRMGISVLLVEQDVTTALELADRGFLVDMGRITLGATSRELAKEPAIKQTYLGA